MVNVSKYTQCSRTNGNSDSPKFSFEKFENPGSWDFYFINVGNFPSYIRNGLDAWEFIQLFLTVNAAIAKGFYDSRREYKIYNLNGCRTAETILVVNGSNIVVGPSLTDSSSDKQPFFRTTTIT